MGNIRETYTSNLPCESVSMQCGPGYIDEDEESEKSFLQSIHMSCHVMSCHVMSCHVMSCHVMSCHIVLYEEMNGILFKFSV